MAALSKGNKKDKEELLPLQVQAGPWQLPPVMNYDMLAERNPLLPKLLLGSMLDSFMSA
ncbi:rCG33236 [Rattus norvegicus]|uniref:RCG33236 n=1 Tax=Rattus norvegicus TaxID=10116 RepID=A6HK71_RAT|nr:rCG33236 [Rattus norvegicus]